MMDIRGGIEAYHHRLAQQQGVGTAGVVRAVGYALRRMERELGPIRFEPNSRDHAVFEGSIRSKSAQCLSKWKARADPFAVGWVRDCLERVFAAQERDFSGVLSALYAGDSLVATHFGMQSGSVCHYWFPSYAPAFAVYSPGLALLHSLARAGSTLGIDFIDLGRGDQPYKSRFMTTAVSLMEGFVCRPAGLEHLVMPARKLWRSRTLQCWMRYLRGFRRKA
jgi:CelD/BcsL family acetyltransferase involved in cellulose biosynthesis